MTRLTLLSQRLEDREDLAYALIRIYLGVALFVRGGMMLADPAAITELAGAQHVYSWYSYIIGAHLVGGAFLAVGLMTRLAALLQLPVVAGAVFFIHIQNGLMTVGQSLELSALVLVLLVIFLIFGAGPFAVDHVIAMRRAERELAFTDDALQAT